MEKGARAFHILALDGEGGHRLDSGPRDCCLNGDVDELRFTGLKPAVMSDEGRGRGFSGGVEPALGDADANRRAIGFAVEGGHAAHRRKGEVCAQVVGERTVLAEGRDRHVDQGRVHFHEVFVADAHGRHRAGASILEEEVGIFHEFEEFGQTLGGGDICFDGCLAAVVDVVSRRASVELARFEAEDFGAEVGEHHRAELGVAIGQVQNAIGAEHGRQFNGQVNTRWESTIGPEYQGTPEENRRM